MPNNAFSANKLIGGTAGCVDNIKHAAMEDGDICIVAVHTSEKFYVYTWDSGNETAEDTTNYTIIIPDDRESGETGAWKLVTLGSSMFDGDDLGDEIWNLGDTSNLLSTWKMLSYYGDLDTAVDTIGSDTVELWVDIDDTLTGNVTVPSNIILRFLVGNTIDPDGNTLTIYSPGNIIAPPNQKIFESEPSWTHGGLIYRGWFGNDPGNVELYDDSTLTSSSGACTWDLSAKHNAYLELTEDVTITATNIPTHTAYFTIMLQQDATGSRTVSWSADFLWPSGTAPTITTTATSGIDVIGCYSRGGKLYCSYVQAFS